MSVYESMLEWKVSSWAYRTQQSCYTSLGNVVAMLLCYTVVYSTILQYTVIYCAILYAVYSDMLWYTVVCCNMLYYIIITIVRSYTRKYQEFVAVCIVTSAQHE